MSRSSRCEPPDTTVKLPELREQNRDTMTVTTGGRKLYKPANICCAAPSHGLMFLPDIMSDEPPATCPTSSRSRPPARGSGHARELPQCRGLFDLISFNCADTLSFYISLSVCVFILAEDTAAAAAAGGSWDTIRRLIFNHTPSSCPLEICFLNLLAVLLRRVHILQFDRVNKSEILYF